MRWRTHCAKPYTSLLSLDNATLSELSGKYGIHVLECATTETDLLTEISLKPAETISAAASKLKGKVSSWLRQQIALEQESRLLGPGYFACTVGKSTAAEVEKYLDSQSEHHGYSTRKLPPVFVEKFDVDESLIRPKHASVVSQFHIVLATTNRIGIFGSEIGKRVTQEWLQRQSDWRIALMKVSFVPDHVHLAVRLHPSISPSEAVVNLMNSAQAIMKRELITAGLNRLWQPSAYVGSFGDLASPQIRKYIEGWKRTL
jgi:REP element-mobilizing transposase RayT